MRPVVCLAVSVSWHALCGCRRAGLSFFALELTCRNEGCVAEAAAVYPGGRRSRLVPGLVFEGRLRGHREDLRAPAESEDEQEFCRPGSEHQQHL